MDATDTLIQQLERPLNNISATPVVYKIKPGDSLSRIITRYYGINYTDPRYKTALASVVYFNDSIKDPNEIFAGQLLRLMPLYEDNATAFCPVPDDFYQEKPVAVATRHRLEPMGNYQERFKHHIPSSPQEQEAFWALAWLHENYGILSTTSGAGFTAWGGLVSQSNNAFIAEVKVLYGQYQGGGLSKNQYDYRRQLALKKYAQKIGPFEKLLLNGKTAREAARINRTKAIPATANIDRHLGRLGRMAQYAKHGGTILTAAGVGMGCYNIAQAQSKQEKNEIFFETIGSTAASVGTTFVLGVYFIATPTGWITALALGVGAAAISMGAGKTAKYAYNRFGEKMDFVKMSKVDQLCK